MHLTTFVISVFKDAKAKMKYIKGYVKNKQSWNLNYCDVSNLYGWAMSQKLPPGGFKWIENTSQFRKRFYTKLQ